MESLNSFLFFSLSNHKKIYLIIRSSFYHKCAMFQEGLSLFLLNLLNKQVRIVQEAILLGDVLKMTAKFLDFFGEILMKNVRDGAIEQYY